MTLMKEKLPKLHQAFKATNISCSIFLFEWIVALYSNIFPLETSARFWDSYLYYGDHFLLKVAIAICHCLEGNLNPPSNSSQGQGQFEMMVLLFKNVGKFVTEEAMFNALESKEISKFS
jgi:hypothetical protein